MMVNTFEQGEGTLKSQSQLKKKKNPKWHYKRNLFSGIKKNLVEVKTIQPLCVRAR